MFVGSRNIKLHSQANFNPDLNQITNSSPKSNPNLEVVETVNQRKLRSENLDDGSVVLGRTTTIERKQIGC